MFIRPHVVFAVIWIGWIVSWMAAAFCSNRTEKLAVTWDTLLYRVALLSVGSWLKARAEEQFLTTELGADAYGAYRRRVPMLVPSLRRRLGNE